MEKPEVFDETHKLVLRLLADGAVDGLRIDHVDGLYDPQKYLQRLQQQYVLSLAKAALQRSRTARPAIGVPRAGPSCQNRRGS